MRLPYDHSNKTAPRPVVVASTSSGSSSSSTSTTPAEPKPMVVTPSSKKSPSVSNKAPVTVENDSSPPRQYPHLNIGAQFTARVNAPTPTTPGASLPKEKVTFQPVEPDSDDDFALEELEQAARTRKDMPAADDVSFSDPGVSDPGVSDIGLMSDVGSPSRGGLQYISESSEDDEEEDGEVSMISQSILQDTESPVAQNKHVTFHNLSPSKSLSNSPASSAFTPPKASGNGGSPASQKSTDEGEDSSPSPQQQQYATQVASQIIKRLDTNSNATNNNNKKPPKPLKARTRVTIHSTTRNTTPQHGTSTPVASNLGVAGTPNAPSPGPPGPPPPNAGAAPYTDTTPVVNNSRKGWSLQDDPNATAGVEEAEKAVNISQETGSTNETSSDWSRSAVDQVTNAVGQLARLGESFLQGSLSPKRQKAASQAGSSSQPPQPMQNNSGYPQQNPGVMQQQPQNLEHQYHQQMDYDPSARPGNTGDLAGALDRMNLAEESTQAARSDDGDDVYVATMNPAQQQSQMNKNQPHLHPQLLQQHQQQFISGQQPMMMQHHQQQQHMSVPGVRSQVMMNNYNNNGTSHVPSQSQSMPYQIPAILASAVSGAPQMSSVVGGGTKESTVSTTSAQRPGSSMHDSSPMMRMRTDPTPPGAAYGLPRTQSEQSQSLQSESIQTEQTGSILSQPSMLSQSVLSQSLQSQSIQSQGTGMVSQGTGMQSQATGMTEEEFHAMKQKKWREKKKIAERSRAREREKLNGSGKKKKKRKGDRFHIDGPGVGGIGVACESGLQNLINMIMSGNCGQNVDSEESEGDESTIEANDNSTQGSEDHTQGSSLVSTSFMSPLSYAESRDLTEDESNLMHISTAPTDTTGFGSKVNLDKMKDKSFIREFISEISSTGIKVLLHKEAGKQSQNALTQPHRVSARLSLGSEGINGTFSEPHVKIWTENDDVVVAFDVFDVRAIEKASVMKLKTYPLALPGNCFLIRLANTDYVFEAPDEEGAARFVHGMRWLIARLSFNLIIGNPMVSCELLQSIPSSPEDMQRDRAMNDIANHLADKTILSVAPEV
eukprot:CAMPEP_0172444338 /NCGR_PEP_ID=MMETSP1065-20121228/4395_1 /TAXON_ID=265537 /ORGANISM="Amphiprora paludosa, Strain CCMP125" /LENGTH=1057 /DNA_ID=CAMNT_0013194829 /DNA_START=124 /DNA_END=3297 /DNA_ORIENTATION=-